MTEYAVVRCRPTESLTVAKILKQGFTSAGEAASWKSKNAPGAAHQVARVINNVPGLLTTLDDFEIAKAIEEERRAALEELEERDAA